MLVMEMTLDSSDVIAIISALVASLSALYSRWALNATKHQNEISLHAERLSIYKGVGNFYSRLAASGTLIKESDVWLFYESVQLSEFYYEKHIYKRLDTAFSNALLLLSKVEEWNVAKENNDENVNILNKKKHGLMRELRDECLSITNEMKVCLRVAKA